MGRQMQRAIRMANSIEGGLAVLAFIKQPDAVEALLSAVDRGVPPVSAISRKLCDHFGEETFRPMAMRQLAGVTVRALLDEYGYVVVKRGTRISRDPLFTSGALYAKQNVPPPAEAPLLGRLVDALSVDELRWVMTYVGEHLKALGRHPEDAE